MSKAIIVMDYINEICSKDGKLSGKGYFDFITRHDVINNLVKSIDEAKKLDFKLIFVKVAFKEDYSDQPKNSPLFGKANEYQALKLGTWGTEYIKELKKFVPDKEIVKNRVSPFFNTELNEYLLKNKVKDLYFAGVSTDLVVMSAAKEAHDKDYNVVVLSKCCAAANDTDHEFAVNNMSKYAKIIEKI